MPKRTNPPDFSPSLLRQARIAKEFTQSDVAAEVGVSTAMVSFWETGRAIPNADRWRKLCEILDVGPLAAQGVGGDSVGATLERVRGAMQAKHMNQKQVADLAGVSQATVSNVLSGKYPPREETLDRIAGAVGVGAYPGNETDPGIGSAEESVFGVTGKVRWKFFDPDRSARADWPTCAGVYMLCDEKERAVYVGQGQNISKRCKAHEQKFWYKAPSVIKAYYVPVEDDVLRGHWRRCLFSVLVPTMSSTRT